MDSLIPDNKAPSICFSRNFVIWTFMLNNVKQSHSCSTVNLSVSSGISSIVVRLLCGWLWINCTCDFSGFVIFIDTLYGELCGFDPGVTRGPMGSTMAVFCCCVGAAVGFVLTGGGELSCFFTCCCLSYQISETFPRTAPLLCCCLIKDVSF